MVDFPIKTSIYKGFSMAMLNNQMVIVSYHLHNALYRATCERLLASKNGMGKSRAQMGRRALGWASRWHLEMLVAIGS